MKSQLVLFSLVIVLVYGQVQEPQACSNKTLGPEELHQLGGDWVLVWLVYNGEKSQYRQFPLMSSSHVTVQAKNHSLTVHEHNTVGGKCVSFNFNMTVVQSSDAIHQLDMHRTEMNIDGEKQAIDSRAKVEFLPGPENTLTLLFRGNNQEDMLALYWREGHRLEQQNPEEIRAKAECAGLSGDSFKEWSYDRLSDFCHKTVLPSLGPEELQQVGGAWVVVALAYDRVKSAGRQIPLMTSYHVEVQVQTDHRRLAVHDHIMLGGQCQFLNVTVPLSGIDTRRLQLRRTLWFEDREEPSFKEKATIEFLHLSANTIRLVFRGQKHENFLLTYRREGHQGEDLEKVLEEHRASAEVLGLSGGDYDEWLYNGVADFCHKTVLPSPGPEELQQVGGAWVGVALAFDRVKSAGRQIPLMTSSHLEVQVQTDDHRLMVHERNMVGGHCASYPFNVTVPLSGAGIHHLQLHRTQWFLNGEELPLDETAMIEVLHLSAKTMRLLYKGQDHENFLLTYRREGYQAEDLQKVLKEHSESAKVLGLSGGDYDEWLYNGVADFCHKKSTGAKVES